MYLPRRELGLPVLATASFAAAGVCLAYVIPSLEYDGWFAIHHHQVEAGLWMGLLLTLTGPAILSLTRPRSNRHGTDRKSKRQDPATTAETSRPSGLVRSGRGEAPLPAALPQPLPLQPDPGSQRIERPQLGPIGHPPAQPHLLERTPPLMSDPTDTATHTVHTIGRSSRGGHNPIWVTMGYLTHDPYAVHMVIGELDPATQQPRDRGTSWLVSREVLVDCVHSGTTAGMMDFVASCPSTNTILLSFGGHDEHGGPLDFNFEIPRHDMTMFLNRCLTLVPSGSEPDHMNIDKALAQLFSPFNDHYPMGDY
jgi:hypothetical protein